MRIHQQGMVEVRPAYQHVGYTSSAVKRLETERPPLALGLSLCTLGLFEFAVVARRARRLGLFVFGILTFAALGSFAWGMWVLEPHPHSRVAYYHDPELITRDRLDRKLLQTSVILVQCGYARGSRRLLPDAEVPEAVRQWAWSPERPTGDLEDRGCDGWGIRLRFEPLPQPGTDEEVFLLASAGPDRHFGTKDDIVVGPFGIVTGAVTDWIAAEVRRPDGASGKQAVPAQPASGRLPDTSGASFTAHGK